MVSIFVEFLLVDNHTEPLPLLVVLLLSAVFVSAVYLAPSLPTSSLQEYLLQVTSLQALQALFYELTEDRDQLLLQHQVK